MKKNDLQVSTSPISGIVGRVDTRQELQLCLQEKELSGLVFQMLNLRPFEKELKNISICRCVFLGCSFTPSLRDYLSYSNHIFGNLVVPFALYPSKLYDKNSLYRYFDAHRPETYEKTPDRIIFKHFQTMGAIAESVEEMLARSLHDFSMRLALQDLLREYPPQSVVAIMGGHKLARGSVAYRKLCMLSQSLTEQGFLMISGGGPGAMEATHLGAWFAGRTKSELNAVIDHLAEAPTYDHPHWLAKAFEVFERYPHTTYKSLSIPTWFYGHEPPTPFATHICKLFENSLREEGLLAVALGGVIYAPGSVGTMQEIFQELAQNHYKSYGCISPMIFFDKQYWQEELPLYPLLCTLRAKGKLNAGIEFHIEDEIDCVVEHIKSHQASFQP